MSDTCIKLIAAHSAQAQVLEQSRRFNVLACGRRWGKTRLCIRLGMETALAGEPVGWFAPTYKLLREAWVESLSTLRPFGSAVHVDTKDRIITLPTGGTIEYWSTQPVHAGDEDSEVARGRRYQRVIYDEAARARRLQADWTKAIRPTLADFRGDAWFPSTPKGHNYFHKLWVRGQGGEVDWASWQMPTATNPYIHPDEIESARRELPADAFEQEYLAQFLANSANPFGIEAIRACIMDELAAGPVVAWGADLAKSTDWTVVIGLNDHGKVCAFQRWQSDWRNTMSRLAGMFREAPALVDATGVGDPIVEDLQSKCPAVEGYKFSASSKQQLMEGLAVSIQRGQVGYPPGIIPNELEVFEYEYRPSGVRYTAPDGMHDDCVDALALAVRCLNMRPAPVRLSITGDDTEDANWFTDAVDNDDMWD